MQSQIGPLPEDDEDLDIAHKHEHLQVEACIAAPVAVRCLLHAESVDMQLLIINEHSMVRSWMLQEGYKVLFQIKGADKLSGKCSVLVAGDIYCLIKTFHRHAMMLFASAMEALKKPAMDKWVFEVACIAHVTASRNHGDSCAAI